MITRQLLLCWGSGHKKFETVEVVDIERRKYIINTSLPGFSGQYGKTLHSCAAFSLAYGLENTCTHSCNISPYCPLNQVIRYIYDRSFTIINRLGSHIHITTSHVTKTVYRYIFFSVIFSHIHVHINSKC